MDNIAEFMAGVTMLHEQLGFLLNHRLVKTLCYNPVTQRSSIDMGVINTSVDLFNDTFCLIKCYTPLVWPEKQALIQDIVQQGILGCSSLHFGSLTFVFRQSPTSQVA